MVNIIFKKNMDTLKKYWANSGILLQIQNARNLEWMEAKGDNFLIKKRNRIVPAYPLKFPKKECIAISKQDIYPKDGCTIIIGMGLGHMAYHILKNANFGHRIIVVEPVLKFIQEALSRYNFTEYIESGRIMIATNKAEVGLAIGEMDGTFVIQSWITLTDKYTMMCEEYAEIIPYTIEVLNQERCGTGTVMGAGAIIAENDIKNLPYCIRYRGIADIKDLYKGKPAVTVNTGPSLTKNIHLLKEIQDKVIIVAVAQALRVLLAYDIKPDFICTVDYGEVNYEHFNGLMDSDVPLVALNRTYAPILKEWQGLKFITVSPSPGSENTVAGVLYDKGSVEAGGSVSHLAWGIAYHLGCNPITTIGLDLAYSLDFKSHIPQVDAGGNVEVDENGMIKWKIKDPRSTLKDKDHCMGYITYAPDHFGGMVPTNVGLASFITSFEKIYEMVHEVNKDIRIFDSTEGGSKKKGTELLTLEKYIETYCKKKIDKSILKPFLTLSPDYEDKIFKSIDLLKKEIRNLNEIISNCNEGIKITEEMNKPDIDRKAFTEASSLNEKHANAAHELSKQNPIVGIAIFHASRKIYSKEYILDAVNRRKFNSVEERKEYVENYLFKNIEYREAAIEKSTMIMKAARDASEKLIPMYEDVLKIFEIYQETKDESLFISKIEQKVDLSDAEKYLAAGNWAHVLVDSMKYKADEDSGHIALKNKALQMRQADIDEADKKAKEERRQDIFDYLRYMEEGQKLGREEKKFPEAIKLFKKAEKLFPEKFDARWGLASAYFHERELDKSIKYYKKLHMDFPEFPRVKFEYGLALIEDNPNDMKEGLKYVSEAMIGTSEFNHFLKDLGHLYYEIANYSDAQKAYEEYKKCFPADNSVNTKLALCYKQLGDYKKAKKLLN